MRILLVKNANRNSKLSGSALVEAVLVIPILLALVGSTYELGSVFQQYLIIQQMAYEGARSASQLEKDSFTSASCYSVNTSGYIRDGVDAQSQSRALTEVLARVEALINQYRNDLRIDCDDRSSDYRCSSTGNSAVPSYAAEFLPQDPKGVKEQALGCGYPAPTTKYSQALAGKKGTIGVKVSGKYVGRVLPFSIYISAESRSLLLSGNQDYSLPRNSNPVGDATNTTPFNGDVND